MKMKNSQSPAIVEFVLAQNAEKETDKHPDFSEKISIGGILYEAAAWFGTVARGNNAGRPFISLRLASETNNSEAKINIALWEKHNRKSQSEAHFRAKESFQSKRFDFSAWIEPAGNLFQLRITAEELSQDDISPEAKQTCTRLAEFKRETARVGRSNRVWR